MTLITMALVGAAAVWLILRLKGGGASPEKVSELIRSGATIVDVRSPAEFRAGSYPGARNIPLQELETRMAEIQKDRPVVVFCASGARSAMAAGLLKRAGYQDIVNAGGLGAMPR